jgi:AcrR family transcriptional regulator
MTKSDPSAAGSRRQMAPGTGAHHGHRRRSRKGEGEQLRVDILDAAEQLLAERGSPDLVSMRAIANRVGVTPPAIYLHFEDKDELFFECCNRRFTEMADQMRDASEQQGSAMGRLEAMGRAYIEFGLSRGEQYEVMLLGKHPASLGPEELLELPGAQALKMAAAAVAEGVAAGELRSDLDPMAAAVALWATTHGMVMVLLDHRKHEFPQGLEETAVIDQLIEMIRSGLLAAPSSGAAD